MEELLIDIKDPNEDNPGINVVMPDFLGGIGTQDKLGKLLSYLEIVSVNDIENKINEQITNKKNIKTEDKIYTPSEEEIKEFFWIHR